MPMAQVLIIDDDPQICDMLCLHLQHMGHAAEFALTLNAAMAIPEAKAKDHQGWDQQKAVGLKRPQGERNNDAGKTG